MFEKNFFWLACCVALLSLVGAMPALGMEKKEEDNSEKAQKERREQIAEWLKALEKEKSDDSDEKSEDNEKVSLEKSLNNDDIETIAEYFYVNEKTRLTSFRSYTKFHATKLFNVLDGRLKDTEFKEKLPAILARIYDLNSILALYIFNALENERKSVYKDALASKYHWYSWYDKSVKKSLTLPRCIWTGKNVDKFLAFGSGAVLGLVAEKGLRKKTMRRELGSKQLGELRFFVGYDLMRRSVDGVLNYAYNLASWGISFAIIADLVRPVNPFVDHSKRKSHLCKMNFNKFAHKGVFASLPVWTSMGIVAGVIGGQVAKWTGLLKNKTESLSLATQKTNS